MSEIFRDRTDGATAKRADLLRRRRDELVTMPHAVRRVIVARRARIAAAVAMLVGGAAMLVATVSPHFATTLAKALPGRDPAVLSTLVCAAWALGIVAYWVARSSAEHRFAVAMSRHVLPGEDLDHDLQRLDHEHPDELARDMAHRLEVRSAALPVAAAAAVLPATVLYLAFAIKSRAWPLESELEAWFVAHGVGLAVLGGLGLVAGALTTRKFARVPLVAPFALSAALATGAFAPYRWWFVGPAVIAATLAVIARRLRIERQQIRAEDPAAGSEVFTIRGALRAAREACSTVRGFVVHHRRAVGLPVIAVLACGLAFGTRALIRHFRVEPVAAANVAIAPAAVTPVIPAPLPASDAYSLTTKPCEGGESGTCVEAHITFDGGTPVELTTVFPGLGAVPAGWGAELQAWSASPVEIEAFGKPVRPYAASGCDARGSSTAIRVIPPSDWTTGKRVATVMFKPTLRLSTACTP